MGAPAAASVDIALGARPPRISLAVSKLCRSIEGCGPLLVVGLKNVHPMANIHLRGLAAQGYLRKAYREQLHARGGNPVDPR